MVSRAGNTGSGDHRMALTYQDQRSTDWPPAEVVAPQGADMTVFSQCMRNRLEAATATPIE